MKSYTIAMTNPCSENWMSMTPTEKGMFCSQCSKHVLDLAYVSDDELLKRLKGTKEFCGRFSPGQLNRPLIPVKVPAHTSFFSRMCSALFLIASSGSIVSAQTTKKTVMAWYENRKDAERNNDGYNQPDKALVEADSLKPNLQGIICDQASRNPLPFLTVHLTGTPWKTTTDSAGHFKFVLPDSMLMKDSINVQVSGNNYYGDFIIEKMNYQSTETYYTAYQHFMIGAVAVGVKGIVIEEPKPMWYQSIFDFLR